MADSPISIKITGDKDIIEAFKDLREYLPKTALRTALRKSAQKMAQLISLAATGFKHPTGKLARNIGVRMRKISGSIIAKVIVNTQGKADNPNNAFYWAFLEKGFHTGHGKGPVVKYPFATPTIESKIQEISQSVFDACDEAIKRAEIKAQR